MLIPKIKKGQATVNYTQIEVRIEVINKVNSKIIYGIKKANEDNEFEKIETNSTSHIFNNLEEGTEYEITIDVINEYGTVSKSKNITTLYHSVPKLTQNNNKIVQSGFYEEYEDMWGKSLWYYAFDRDASTYNSTTKQSYEAIGSYIGYDFARTILITEVTGKIRMLSYKIQYSDDLELWSDAITANSLGSDAGDNFSHEIDENIGAHRYWRLYVNGGQNSGNWGALVWSLQFNGKQEKETINII